MEFKFESDLDYQLEAINSVISLLKGQKDTSKKFKLIPESTTIPNEFNLSDKELLDNLKNLQKLNKIKESDELDSNDFSIEMETGTGKTYVYLRTIMELNKNYGFKKFIIIVPSVAIKEGVLKTLEITKTHFKLLYNLPYNYYEYDSSKLSRIRQFSRNNNIEIMIMTLDSFNKDTNIMNLSHDKLRGQRPIDLVSQTRPVLILDEPQNMESENAKNAITQLNPLFKLRYSATHRIFYNLIYRLTPVDAYNKGLVKKIEVDSVVKEDDYNNLYLRCLNISADAKGIKAQLEVNKKQKTGFKLGKITVKLNDDLYNKTKASDYEGVKVTEINANYNYIRFSNGLKILLGEDTGGDRKKLMRSQIRQTIEEHFEKQLILKHYGIKVLSLFFIDKVDNYLNENGFIRKYFEEEFLNIQSSYTEFKDLDVSKVHGGYFSTKSSESGMKKDKIIFDKIMRNKEQLLTFSEPLQFIFSHSALREGWDNPNVFNICTLNQTVSNIKKRQEIGRGVRLPVNQEGNRLKNNKHNILTVVANESYADYVSKLQIEYIEDYGESPPIPPEKRNRKTIKLKKGFQLKPEFKELWERISKQTKYKVNVDTEKLIESCIEEINKITLNTIKIRIEKVSISIEDDGIKTHFVGQGSEELAKDFSISNILDIISKEAKITKKTIYMILVGIENLDLIFINPQDFINSVTLIIKEKLKNFLVNGIKYIELNESWQMKLFENIETYEEHYFEVEKSIYDAIQFDSNGERTFAYDLDRMDNVKLFIKLPFWFKIQTPIGTYNPDWAIVIEDNDQHGQLREKLYLIRETKFYRNFSMEHMDEISLEEQIKINCALEHFKTIGVDFKAINDIKYLI